MTQPNRATRRREASAARTPVNRARGETVLTVPAIGEGEAREYKLCLTLAAIAEIEDGLGVENLQEIETALQSAGSRQFACILAALARGAGHDVTVDDARRWPITMQDALIAIVGAFKGAGAMTDGEYREDGAQSAGEPQRGN
jgi:hypothetical protein